MLNIPNIKSTDNAKHLNGAYHERFKENSPRFNLTFCCKWPQYSSKWIRVPGVNT